MAQKSVTCDVVIKTNTSGRRGILDLNNCIFADTWTRLKLKQESHGPHRLPKQQ